MWRAGCEIYSVSHRTTSDTPHRFPVRSSFHLRLSFIHVPGSITACSHPSRCIKEAGSDLKYPQLEVARSSVPLRWTIPPFFHQVEEVMLRPGGENENQNETKRHDERKFRFSASEYFDGDQRSKRECPECQPGPPISPGTHTCHREQMQTFMPGECAPTGNGFFFPVHFLLVHARSAVTSSSEKETPWTIRIT